MLLFIMFVMHHLMHEDDEGFSSGKLHYQVYLR